MDDNLLHITCRGCLIVEENSILHSFQNKIVRELFTNCTKVKISLQETHLPMQICSLCFGRCENWQGFQERCQANDQDLRIRIPPNKQQDDEADEEVLEEQLSEERVWYQEETETSETVQILKVEDDEIEESPYDTLEIEDSTSQDPIEVDVSMNTRTRKNTAEQKFVCEQCGDHLTGELRLRKHMLQHKLNVTKRVRSIERTLSRLSHVSVDEKEEDALLKSWTQKRRKKLKNSGQVYVDTAGRLRDKRSVRPCPCKCNHKCKTFSEEERQKFFDEYWSRDYGGQRKFIFDNIIEKKCNRHTTSATDSRRQNTLEYFLAGNRVCKVFFTSTLDIVDKVILTCMKKAREGKDHTMDYRGWTKRGANAEK